MKLNTAIGFEYECSWVVNPYITIDGRGDCDPFVEYEKTHDDLLVIFKSQEYLDWLKETGEVMEEE